MKRHYVPDWHRFIPARAGNTRAQYFVPLVGTVHPRSRGEHPTSDWKALARPRFIPARAGNTAEYRYWSFSEPVHPRSRGEHVRC